MASNFPNGPRADENPTPAELSRSAAFDVVRVVKPRRSRLPVWILSALLPLGASAWATLLSAKPPPRPRAEAARPRAATYVGFYVFRDGSSRIYVNLTSDVPVEVKNRGKIVEYLLKDAEVLVPNNKNPLIMEHFGSPVVSAQLVPTKEGAVLRIELRRKIRATHEMRRHVDGSATLHVNFPRAG